MKTSATRKIFTLRRKASGMTRSDSRKTSPSKKSCLTSGQPGEFVTTSATTTTNTIVLASAISVLRRPEAPEALKTGLLEDGRSGRVDPLLLDLLDRAVGLERGDRLVDAVAEGVALLE